MDTKIKIQALKYGGKLHYEWQAALLEKTEAYIVVLAEKDRKLHHHTRGKVFTVPNWTLEVFPFDSWFTVSADVARGRIYQYYCNINEPAKMNGITVSFVDLALDLVQRNGEWKVVDEDEFEKHAVELSYPEDLKQRARQELANLQERVKTGGFPFDGTLVRFIPFIGKTY